MRRWLRSNGSLSLTKAHHITEQNKNNKYKFYQSKDRHEAAMTVIIIFEAMLPYEKKKTES